MLAPDALAKIHPLGKSPVITDGDVTVAESGAILEYLVEHTATASSRPRRGTPAFRDYRYFMHYAEGSLMPLLLMKLIFARVKSRCAVPGPADREDDREQGRQQLRRSEPRAPPRVPRATTSTSARGSPASELTAADVQMSYPMEAIGARVPDSAAIFRTYVERMKARPAFAKALERGGPYSIMD